MNNENNISIEQVSSNNDLVDIAIIGSNTLPIYYTTIHLLEIVNNPLYYIIKISITNKLQNNNINTIGFIILKQNESKKLHIMSIAILEEYQGCGYGSMLINYLKSNYPKYSYSLYVQTVNIKGISFYKKHGFKIVKLIENYYTELDEKNAYICEYYDDFA
jgi:ribosomal protein S18 acetylase RimI-like enzyme